MLSGYYVISMISLIRSILSVIFGFILLFVVSFDNIDELPESFRIGFYIIYLLTVGLEMAASILGLKVKKNPAVINKSLILYIIAFVFLAVMAVQQFGISFGLLAYVIIFFVLFYGIKIRKWVKAGMPCDDQP